MENKMKTFENYLEEICFKIHWEVLDDDMPDYFENWLGELDGEDYMKWAEQFGTEMYLKGKEEVLEKIQDKSICCNAPMLGGVQCEVCGADGRKEK